MLFFVYRKADNGPFRFQQKASWALSFNGKCTLSDDCVILNAFERHSPNNWAVFEVT